MFAVGGFDTRYHETIDTEGGIIAALFDALAGTGKSLVTAFGSGLLAPDHTPTEDEAATRQ